MKRALLSLLFLVACASGVGSRAASEPAPFATLTVHNDRYYDAAVFIAHHGSRSRRLEGYVTGNDARTYALKQSDFDGGTLQLLAKYVGDGMTVLSDEVTLVAGAHYSWQLGPTRGVESLSYQARADGEVALPDGTAVLDSTKVCRAPSCRSTTQRERFKRLTGYPKGRAGWVIDHMKPLECGGEDLPTNMMWQTVEEAKAKDRIERDCSRWLP